EYGPDVRGAEAAGRTQDQCRSGDRAAAAQTVAYPRRDAVSAIGAGPADRRAHVERAVSVHALRREPGRAVHLGAATAGAAAQDSATEGRQQRPADHRA